MIRVMFLETCLGVGGSEQMWYELIRRLDRTRFSPMLCCLYDPGVLGERLAAQGVRVFQRLVASRWDWRVVFRLTSLLRRERIDVLYMINQPLTQFWGTLCGRLAGVSVLVSSIHSTGKINRIRRRLLINRLTLPFVHTVTALSRTHRAYLVERERIDPDKLEIIPNGIDVERFSARTQPDDLRRPLGLVNGEPIVGVVAMLRPEKAHEVFLEASACVLERVPAARFLIVGDGPQRPRLEALAKTLGIDRQVHFLGLRDDVPQMVSLFDVAVLSSRPVVETLSISVLEYMAAGKPVVATRVGSLLELIEEGTNGFLVEPGNSQALANRIICLLQDRGLAHRMGEEGRRKVRQRYTVDQMVRSAEALFEQLVNGKRAERCA